MLELGITRIEVGVQTMQENIYKIVNRGHNLRDIKIHSKLQRIADTKL